MKNADTRPRMIPRDTTNHPPSHSSNLPEQKSFKPEKESLSTSALEIHRQTTRNGAKDCALDLCQYETKNPICEWLNHNSILSNCFQG
jgi:hypothetical protein